MSEGAVLAALRRARLAAFRAGRLCLSAASPAIVRLRLSARTRVTSEAWNSQRLGSTAQ